MKHTIVVNLIAVLLPLFSAGGTGMSYDQPAVGKTGEIVYVTGDRIYLSLGRLDGVTREWVVERIQGIDDVNHLQLSWIGEDLCRFDFTMADSLRTGDTVWLAKISDLWDKHKTTTLNWAVMSLPISPDRDPRTLNDWDFREDLFPHIGDIIDSIDVDITGNTVWYLKEYLNVSDSAEEITDAVCSTVRKLCLMPGPYTPFAEQFSDSGDSLECAEIAPYTLRTNLNPGYSQNRSWLDSPVFCCLSESCVNDEELSPYRLVASGSNSLTLAASRYGSIVDTIRLIAYDSYEAAKLAFELGEVDVVDIAPFDVVRFEDNYDVIKSPAMSAVFLSVNNRKTYFSDNLFATALNYLVDKRSLCRVPLDGMVEPIDYPPVIGDQSVRVQYEYNPAKGTRLLNQIDDLPEFMSLLVSDASDPALLRTANYIQGLLRRHGISLTVYTDPFVDEQNVSSSFFESFDMMLAVLRSPSGTGEELLYQSWYHDDFAEVESNRSLYRSSTMSRLFAEAYLSPAGTDADRERANRKIISEHLNAPSGVWLYAPVRYTAISSKVISIEFLPSGIAMFNTILLE